MKENLPKVSKKRLAQTLGVSRQSSYYINRKDEKDWKLKIRIESILRDRQSYGSRRIAWALKLNRKGVQRVMRKYGIQLFFIRIMEENMILMLLSQH